MDVQCASHIPYFQTLQVLDVIRSLLNINTQALTGTPLDLVLYHEYGPI